MTMSRADSLAYLNANGLPHSSYFGTVSGAGTRSMIETLALAGPQEHHGDGVVSPSGGSGNNGSGRTMCGSDAISLLDLEDNDLVMIDSNGNSSNSGVTGTAIVSETIASASAIVSKNSQSSSSHNPFSHFGGGVGGGGRGSGGTLTYSASTALMEASGTAAVTSGSNNHHYPGGSSASSNLSPRSSLPSLTTQAKKDAMQRAAMIAAIQQNGGAKILTAHRVGRRHDRPSRGIRFGEFHRICEIEYGFKEGKPLIANGRTLVHTASVQRIEDDSIQEDMLYLFSDVLVTGTKIKPVPSSSTTEDYLDHGPKINEGVNVKIGELDVPYPLSISSEGQPTQDSVLTAAESEEAVFDNPYAGHLENQQISRLTQVQADVVEGDERPLLKLTVPQVTSVLLFGSTSSRDNFLTLLSETTVAHKHHLLFQSKYLADLKKFKRHSAFSFDTSFLKTWGIPGGLNLGSIRHTAGNGGSGHSIIGPGTFTASPTNSPGGGAFDPYQYQQHLNRPQSMAGSLFNFALNGGSFPSFTSSSSDHHSKESSYATLRGANATQALQYHHQQQQMLQQQLQNRLSTTSFSGGGGIGGRPGIGDRTSSGSAFDALWFMKGSETFKQQPPRRTAAEAVSAISHEDKELKKDDDSSAGVPPATTMTGSASSSLHSSSSTTNLSSLSSNGSSAIANIGNYANRLSSSGFSSQHHVGTLRGGDVGWVRDEDATVCMVCSITKFGVLVRKHHCRLCGRVICWKCCQMKDAILLKPSNDSNGDNTSVVQEQQQLRKPIRVCLECIEQDAEDSPQQQQQEQEPSSPQSPQSPLSFPLQGVFGKLMNATISSPHLVTSAMNATGSTFTMPHQAQAHRHPQIPFQMSQPSSLYPRATSFTRNGTAYPHHHRASLYRIDVERVGEEDEGEEEEEEKEKEEERQDNSRWAADMTHQPSEHTNDSTSAVKEVRDNRERSMDVTDSQPSSSSSSLSKIMKSNHGTLRLKDLDPSDINEEEVNSQIMSLESEVESLLIQSAAAAAAAAAASSPMAFTGTNYSSANAGKTRVLRSMPKEFFEVSGFLGERGDIDEGEGEAEEKTVEELLAQQEGLQHMLA
ncbi:hypothetical protein BGX28_007271 [Mortierella sp. GBA30]|nr:hypothetical protein BGX28_007271 [Mortierella sp. GBA30]